MWFLEKVENWISVLFTLEWKELAGKIVVQMTLNEIVEIFSKLVWS